MNTILQNEYNEILLLIQGFSHDFDVPSDIPPIIYQYYPYGDDENENSQSPKK